ncbi:MAG TPA: Type 1 glutamine amidotransferase-like domain-containing protein [Fimbriimonas sp.]
MNIVAIGGGEVGIGETEILDRELIRLSGKTNPLVLFVPTASQDDATYVQTVRGAYSRLGCTVEALRLWGEDGSSETAQDKIARADLVYVGGGNTKAMIARWRQLGVDRFLRGHLEAGKPAGGVSAGALCWFQAGNSDWPQFEGIPDVLTAKVDCLGFVDLVLCPHASREPFRLGDFREMMRSEPGVGVALDDNCAIQIRGEEYRILASQPGAVAHRVQWIEGILHERQLPPHTDFRSLDAVRRA